MNKISTVIIDSQKPSLARLESLLLKTNKVDLLGAYEDAEEALTFIHQVLPDLIVLEVEMPKISGLKLAKELKKRSPNTKVIFYSEHTHYAIKAIKTSAFDYLLKPISIDELQNSLNRFSVNFKMNLTEKELKIIREMSDGLSSKSIGEKLFISKHTVDKYRRNILDKTSCQNSAELIKLASQVGIV